MVLINPFLMNNKPEKNVVFFFFSSKTLDSVAITENIRTNVK